LNEWSSLLPEKNYEPKRFQSNEYLAVISDSPAELTACFTQDAVQHMKALAEAGYPLEICGLLLGSVTSKGWIVQEAQEVENLNKERAKDRFQLDPLGYQTIDKSTRGTALEIIGVFHSHPDCPAKPSPTDLDSAWEGFLYPIISVCDGKVANMQCWEPSDVSQRFHPVSYAVKTV